MAVDRRRLVAPVPAGQETSREPRSLEFELLVPADAPAGPLRLAGFADYWVCQGRTGECHYLRQDLVVEVRVAR